MQESPRNRFYTALWCLENEEALRRHIPFDELGKSLRDHNSSATIMIVVLEGFNKLSNAFLDHLLSLGFETFDYSAEFDRIVNRFPNIARRYSRYERNCFLRWIAFKEITDGKRAQFWHIDSDVVLHASLDAIASDTSGKTFMLEGCPVLVSVSEREWFRTYETELTKLDADIDGYSAKAWARKPICKMNDPALANQSLFRNPLGSDQDFLEYLISSKTLTQDPASVIFSSRFHWVQNPLVFSLWDRLQAAPEAFPMARTERDGGISYAGKRVPFIHHQGGEFSQLAIIYLTMVKFGLMRFRIIRNLLDFNIVETSFRLSPAAKIVLKLSKVFGSRCPRSEMIRLLLSHDRHSKEMHIVELINFINEKGKPKILRPSEQS